MNIQDQIKSLIQIKGHLSIAEFMQEALFNPVHGYYQKAMPFGKDGDFITAPEISQVFGELIGLYFLNLSANSKGKIAFVEMGAGKGTLFYDLLLVIKKLADKKVDLAQEFLQRTSFHIVEISPVLKENQQKKLKDFNINWHKDFASFSKSIKDEQIYFLANELFDCFPINQFVKTKEGWCEKVVSLKDENLQFFIEDFNPIKHKTIQQLVEKETPINSVFEYSFSAMSFLDELLKSLTPASIALIIDYGYIKNEFKDSLQSLKSHKYHNCLENIGQADITSLVNFSALQKLVQESAFNSSLITQKEFLESLGINERQKLLLEGKESEEQSQINSQINRLIDEKEMGELFKCLIIWK